MRTSRFALRLLLVFVTFGLAAVVSGCDEDDDDETDPDDDAGTDDDDTDPGDDAGDDDDTSDVPPYAAVQALIDEYVAFTGEPGIALAWSRADEPAQTRTAGLAELQTGVPLGADSRFRIGSATKPFIAAVTMQLVDEGRIGLDNAVQEYLPEYTQWPGLTVRHLLSMRGGVADYLNSFVFWLKALTHPEEPFTPDELVGYALDMPPTFPPGEGCDYSDTNYVLLGMLIERVTGNGVGIVLRDRIFTPLGLSATFLDEAGQEVPGLAHGYADTELAGPLLNIDEGLQQLIELAAPHYVIEGTLVDGTYLVHPTFSWTAGGLVSTPRDVAVFMRAWVGGELASEEAMAEVLDFGPCEILGEGVEYGLGLERVATDFGYAIGHGGLNFGYATTARYLPDSDLTFAVVNNFLPEQLWYIQDELLAALHDPSLPTHAACRPPDGFLDATGENLLQVRFRGYVYDAEGGGGEFTDEDTGLSGSRVRQDGAWRAYNGYGAYAYANGSYLTVESIGPKRTDDWDARSVSVDLAVEMFRGLGASGVAEIANDRLDLFNAVLYDVDEDAWAGGPRMCFHAVPDPAATSRFYACDTDPVPSGPGDAVKVFANIPMTLDPTAIGAYVARLGLATCICMDADWNWEPC
jgi:D-alanyl-D-alanine carboxypeptidase